MVLAFVQLASMSDELRRAIYATNGASFDTDILPPDLIGLTEILTEDHRKELCRHLPARAEGESCQPSPLKILKAHFLGLSSISRRNTLKHTPYRILSLGDSNCPW